MRCATQYAGLGRQIVERAFERAGKTIPRRSSKARCRGWRGPRSRMCWPLSDAARCFPSTSSSAIYPDYKEERRRRRSRRRPRAAGSGMQKRQGGEVQGSGRRQCRASRSAASMRDLPVRFAPQGGAVPGDRIVGIMTPGEGITIYPIQSAITQAIRRRAGTLARRALGRRGAVAAAVSGAARVHSVNEPGTLGPITQVIGEHDGNIDNIRHDPPIAGFHRNDDRSRGL